MLAEHFLPGLDQRSGGRSSFHGSLYVKLDLYLTSANHAGMPAAEFAEEPEQLVSIHRYIAPLLHVGMTMTFVPMT